MRQHVTKFVQLRLCRVVVCEPSGALHLAYYRVKGAIRVLGRAEVAQARVWLASKAVHERSGQSRFANTGFTREQHNLPFADLCFRPAPPHRRAAGNSTEKIASSATVCLILPAKGRNFVWPNLGTRTILDARGRSPQVPVK